MYRLYVFFRYADCWICNTWCKDNANERNESLLSNCRVQLIFCKDTKKKIKESSRSGNSYTIIINNFKKLNNEDC